MKKIFSIIFFLLVMTSCSLLKFSINTGQNPLPSDQLNTRIIVRGFYNEFTNEIIESADSIVKSSDSLNVKLNAIRWKLGATSAASSAAFQSVPDVALINMWVLCERMDRLMNDPETKKLFGIQTHIAKNSSARLKQKITILARKILPSHKFSNMGKFVTNYVDNNPMTDLSFVPVSLMLEWINYTGASDSTYIKTVGSMSEVMADMGDKMSGYSSQFANELTWTKDVIMMQMQNDSLQRKLSTQFDSISRDFNKMVLILEHSPELMDTLTKNFNVQLTLLIQNMNNSVNNAFLNFSRERIALEAFLNEQRGLIMEQTQKTVNSAIETALAELPALIGKIIFYIVIALVILFSIPFVLGYLLGRAREKQNAKKSNSKKQNTTKADEAEKNL